ncbi:MAG: glycosyltransferase [Candidatus Methanosuratincola sp.]
MTTLLITEGDLNQQYEPKDEPLVSVIIGFFNEEQYLQEAIESVIAQTYSNWELILVDDGSTDRSTAIAHAFEKLNPEKIYYVDHEGHQNRGVCASRNLGITKANGKYIAFLDADDVWLPHKLNRQVQILEENPEAGMLYGLSRWWYSWTKKSEDYGRDFVYKLGLPSGTLLYPLSLINQFFITQKAAIPTPSNILIRREVLEKAGGFEESFEGKNISYEDQAFYAKVGLVSPILATDECWDLYRQHPESACAVAEKNEWGLEIRVFFLKWLKSYIEEKGFRGTDTWRALRKEIWRTRILSFLPIKMEWNSSRQKMIDLFLPIARKVLPAPVRSWLWAVMTGTPYLPPVGRVKLGHLRRLSPFSREYGYDRGRPVDRHYIESFLKNYELDIQGDVLEIADDSYTRRFGGERVTKSEVLHAEPGNPQATIVGDLTDADQIPANTFDCIILTQTLQVIYDVRAALQTVYRILKPGGVILATFPGISQISGYDKERWGYYWSFTSLSARRLFEEIFPPECVQVNASGNVLVATAFLYGMAAEELKPEELDHNDPDYEVVITVRAEKPA